jgi:GDP-L-fucose synthase
MNKFYKGKKILVAGGSGMIGTELCKRLINLGSYVTIASIDSDAKVRSKFKGYPIKFLNMDLQIRENCEYATKGKDYVFNLICLKGSTQIGYNRVADMLVSSILCNTYLMEFSRIHNVERFLFTGSINEYPNISPRKEDDIWTGEPEANDRFNAYAKRIGERQAEAYRLQHGWDNVRIVRLSNVYGAYDNFDIKTGHAIPALIHKVCIGENPLIVAGDGRAIRDFIYLEDVVDGILLSMENAPPLVPINLGSGKPYSIKRVVKSIINCVKDKPKVVWDISKAVGDSARVLDVSRARKILGFSASHSLEEGIKKTFSWFKDHQNE